MTGAPGGHAGRTHWREETTPNRDWMRPEQLLPALIPIVLCDSGHRSVRADRPGVAPLIRGISVSPNSAFGVVRTPPKSWVVIALHSSSVRIDPHVFSGSHFALPLRVCRRAPASSCQALNHDPESLFGV